MRNSEAKLSVLTTGSRPRSGNAATPIPYASVRGYPALFFRVLEPVHIYVLDMAIYAVCCFVSLLSTNVRADKKKKLHAPTGFSNTPKQIGSGLGW